MCQNKNEKDDQCNRIIFDDDGKSITVLPEGKDEKRFTFDQVFAPKTTQEVEGREGWIIDRAFLKE